MWSWRSRGRSVLDFGRVDGDVVDPKTGRRRGERLQYVLLCRQSQWSERMSWRWRGWYRGVGINLEGQILSI
jgi:hypothetical protein